VKFGSYLHVTGTDQLKREMATAATKHRTERQIYGGPHESLAQDRPETPARVAIPWSDRESIIPNSVRLHLQATGERLSRCSWTADQFASLVDRDALHGTKPDVELIARVLALAGSNQCTFVHQVD
jgi:hypothetical protein